MLVNAERKGELGRRMHLTRRTLVSAAGVSAAVAPTSARDAPVQGRFDPAELGAVVERYHGFGIKASGGPGDQSCGAWLEGELARAGYRTSRQALAVPYFDADIATLTVGGASASVIPQAVVVPTGAGGVSGPLVLRQSWSAERPCPGAIALVLLPHRRWSSAISPEVRRPVAAAIAAGAAAVVIIPTGPTGEALALNAPVAGPLFPRPTAVLAPKDAAPFLRAAEQGGGGRLVLHGRGGSRPAYNLIGQLDRGGGRRLVISTPRSGWFTCTGERGPGVAIWLALARWAAALPSGPSVTLLCTSGHEYENAGGAAFLEQLAPRPAETALWVHLGANAAARDWQEAGASAEPLPSADPQRYLMVTPDLLAPSRSAFAGLPGLEAVHPAGSGAAGELTHILGAGYGSVIGVFGAHRFHHAPSDGLQCVSAPLIARTAEAFRAVAAERLGRHGA